MSMSKPAQTPEPPYYAVIFTSVRTPVDKGYEEAALRMVELARRQPGFLGVESVRDGGLGITVSYWSSLEAIDMWKLHVEHVEVKQQGRAEWYEAYCLRVARVERSTEYSST